MVSSRLLLEKREPTYDQEITMKSIMFAIAAVFALSTVSFANDHAKTDCTKKENHDHADCKKADHK